MSMPLHRFAATIVLCVLACRGAHAIAPVCIASGDSAGLKAALVNAASSIAGSEVRVEQGTYTVSSGWIFTITPDHDLSLLGGYVPNTGCQQRYLTASPATPGSNTILDGHGIDGTTVRFATTTTNPNNRPFGRFTLEGFEIRGLAYSSSAPLVSVSWDAYNAATSTGVLLRYNWVHGNSVNAQPAVQVTTGGALDIVNNLFNGNSGGALAVSSPIVNAAPWRIVHNTIAGNTGIGLQLFNQSFKADLEMFNNILYGNGGNDLQVSGTTVELHGDTYGTSGTTNGGAIVNRGYAFPATNPQMDSTYHLVSTSGSINSGSAIAGLLPAQDLDGNPRWVGSNPDRGAFESNTGDQAYWLVTSSSDESHATNSSVNCNPGSPTCTLREAITRANVSGASMIGFHLGSSCGPQYIQLNSPLPNVNVPLFVDGLTQPGAKANTVAIGGSATLDESLCVVIQNGLFNTVASAFVVGSTNYGAQLEVRGITFSGFRGYPISIQQGSYHWIHGNTFGLGTSTSATIYSNAAGVLLGGGSTFSTIGGNDPADVNLFGDMNTASAAVVVSSANNGNFNNIVAGNQFGLGLASGADEPNQGVALRIDGGRYNDIHGNIIVAGSSDGIVVNNGVYNWVHNNQIGGVPGAGNTLVTAFANLGSGIVISGGSNLNAIGAFDWTGGPGYENAIMNNINAGVWVQADAGVRNSVVGNSVSENHGGLAMDLGSKGYGIGTGTPNDAQPAPTLHEGLATSYLLDTSQFFVNYTFTGASATSYRIDFYASTAASCTFAPAEHQVYTLYLAGTGAAQTATAAFVYPLAYGTTPPVYVTATATNLSGAKGGDTSEISNCITLQKDRIFANGFEAQTVAL
jgi:hypothetical protein